MEPSSWQIPLSAARPIRTLSSKLPCLAQVIFSERTADDANDRPQTDQGSHFRSSIYGKSAGNVSHGAGGVNARVNLRRNNFDPLVKIHFFSTVDALQSSLSRLFSHTADRCGHPTLRQVVSTWTRCGGRLAPRRANEGYTAEPSALARLVCQAYHSVSRSYALPPPNASTRSLRMPAEQALPPLTPTSRRWPVAAVQRQDKLTHNADHCTPAYN